MNMNKSQFLELFKIKDLVSVLHGPDKSFISKAYEEIT